MAKSIFKKIIEKVKGKGIEINLSVKVSNNMDNTIGQKVIKKPIYFEKEV